MRIFLAGASGTIGRRLCILLRDAGHSVVGTTRSPVKAEALRAAGITPVVVDVLDEQALLRAVVAARPEVIVHQLTDLPHVATGADMQAAMKRNGEIRRLATPNLMRAAQAAGARRAIVQSVCFAYADGPTPHVETDPLDATPARRVTVEGVQALETAAMEAEGVSGIVLRYGRLYGQDTWTSTPTGPAPLHVDAAAHAALLALTRGTSGVYNIAEDDGFVAIDKARRELGFDPAYRLTS